MIWSWQIKLEDRDKWRKINLPAWLRPLWGLIFPSVFAIYRRLGGYVPITLRTRIERRYFQMEGKLKECLHIYDAPVVLYDDKDLYLTPEELVTTGLPSDLRIPRLYECN